MTEDVNTTKEVAEPQQETTTPVDPVEVKPSWFWVKDSKGNASVSTTFVLIAFLVVTVAYVLSIIDHIGTFQVRAFDVGACAAYLTPLLALYFGRRWTESKSDAASKQ